MKKIKKSMAAVALSLAMGLTTVGIPGEPVMEVHAEVTPDSSISLSDASTVTADTAGSVLQIYGDGSTVYDVPISVTANCTVLLDNIENTADLTVETGVTANIVIRGNCSLGNIVAVGGVRTNVTISGEDGSGTLTTGNIAQAKAGQAMNDGYPDYPEMGANVKIEDCTVICDNVGCGSDGLGWSYDQFHNGDERSYASKAGSASSMVAIRNATVNARGSIACGGNGIIKIGDDRCIASDGGRAGNVIIANSCVTVGGSVSIGGQGGTGCVTGTNNTVTGGEAMSPGIVTIINNSVVKVTGNVATAPDLAEESYRSDQNGLSGGDVVVDKSSLTCKDIASGGCGIGKTYYSVSSSNTTYYGTNGGQGGVLTAKDAVINCETACNGGEAGEYCEQTVGEEPSYEGHPQDGHGGRIEATNSRIKVTDTACQKGMKWATYGAPYAYNSVPKFIGGALYGGEIHGVTITLDLTAIFDCEIVADSAVVNSEGTTASRCILKTSDEMAGETVDVTANAVSGSAILNESGQLMTYLATGTNEVKIAGTKTYVGSCLVEANPVFNIFSLEAESIPETPDDGDEEIPGAGGEETPGTGGEETPGTGVEETPGAGGEETPGTGGEETPGTGSEETPPVTEHEIEIPTAVTGSAVTVLVGEQTLNLESDENGNIQFTIAPDVTEFFIITEPFKYRYPVTDGVPGDPSIVGPTAVLSGNGMLTEGDLLHLTVEAAASLETNTLSYEWYKDDIMLAVSSSALDISEAALSDAGSYYVVVTESNGQSVTTAAIVVSVDAGTGTGGSSGETGDSSGETAGGGSGNTSEENTGGTGEDNSGEGSGSTSGDTSGGSTGTETGGNTGEPSGGNAGDSSGGSAGGSSGGSSSGGSGGSSGGFGGGSTGGTSGGSSGGSSGDSAGGASGGASSQTPTDQSASDTSEKTEDPAGQVTSIQMKSNLNGIKLIPTSEKNTYKKYFSKTVKLTVSKEPGCTYYYKVVEKGKANSTVKWKKLTGNVIKVADSDTAKRIYIRAVNENGTSVTRKTTGFYVDNRKPVVKGVTNKAVYTKPVKIRFSDNISVKTATLNGKKVKNGCTVSKKGAYRLVVTDRAGNKRVIKFTIRK